jgi:hypothetical protein
MSRRISVSALLLAVSLLAIPALAQSTYDWSMIGSAGSVDPSSSAAYAHAGPALKFATGWTGTIVARYPVTNTYGSSVDVTPPWQYLILSYANNSALGTVSARLMRVSHCSSDEEEMCHVNGGNTAGESACGHCLFNPGELDFSDNSYYVEVTLTRSAPTATPQVNTVAIGN